MVIVNFTDTYPQFNSEAEVYDRYVNLEQVVAFEAVNEKTKIMLTGGHCVMVDMQHDEIDKLISDLVG